MRRSSAVAFATLAIAAATATGGATPGVAAPSISPAYVSARADVQRDGRAVAALVRAGDAPAIFARFSPALARAVPLPTVKHVLRETLASAPVGRRTGETVLPAAPDRRLYLADHRWGDRMVALRVSFYRTGAIAGIDLRPRTALPRDPHPGRTLRARLTLPFRGEWWVFWGGRSERQNYHVIAPDQRHAYDILGWRSGATHRGAGTVNADYWAWGRPIVAPANAVVVTAVDGVRDNTPQVEVENPRAPFGNHVVLDLGTGEYAVLAHLRRGGVVVRPGQRVRVGDLLGRCGDSGNSSEPHLHFHVQDRAQLLAGARGLPVSFRDYVADGRRVARGAPLQGQFVARCRDDLPRSPRRSPGWLSACPVW